MREAIFTVLSRVRALFRRATADADFDQEVETHLAMAEEEHCRRGLSADDARRQARLELGGIAQLREAARETRALPGVECLWLDTRLGVRMLRKSWGLTLVAGLAMAVTIGLGASIFTIWRAFAGTDLPLDEGDRIVAIQPVDRASQRVYRSTTVPDFKRWRDTVKSVENVSAMRTIEPIVIARDAAPGRVPTAEMTASAFQLARVPPVLGRPLIEQDEREGAEPVVVIGYDLWRSGFSSDTHVLGQRIQVGDTHRTIVGVMPESFRFPMNQRLWLPLRTDAAGDGSRQPEDVFVFARLVPGAALERASAEVAALGLLPRDVAATPRLEPRVVPYAMGIFPEVPTSNWISGIIFLVGALLLVPPCANIAILVYARTVTRREEFATRSALGASRGRIVMQLFVEVFVLAIGTGIVALVFARQLSGRLSRIVMPTSNPDSLAFWLDFTPSFATVACVLGFCVLAAAIAGAVPAFHATGRWRRSGMLGSQYRDTGARLGMTWTALLATQVALSLAILPSALEMTWGIFRPAIMGPKLPVNEFLTASLAIEGNASRFATLQSEALRQLASTPGISGVTASAAVLLEESSERVEVEGVDRSETDARLNSVDRSYFDVFGARFLAGRGFEPRDFGDATGTSVIVNRTFVDEVVGEGSPLGRRVRSVSRDESGRIATSAPWYEIVGVVEDFPANNDGPTMYRPMARATHFVSLTIRAPSGAGLAATRLRAIAAALDPNLRAGRIRSLAEIYWQRRSVEHTFGALLGTIVAMVLLFSVAGVYTLMAFIVAQRRREIGVRSALGAEPRRLLVGIFGRATIPLLIGAIVGCALAIAINEALPITMAGGQRIPGVVPVSAALLIFVGVLAVAGPARRAIRVNPTEALRLS